MPKKKKPPYYVSLTIGTDVLEGTGDTALEALQALPEPLKLSAKGILTVEHEGTRYQSLLMPAKLKQLWRAGVKPLTARNIERGLFGVRV